MTERSAAPADRPVRSLIGVRWIVLALLLGFSAIAYIERVNLSVAGRFMRDDLGLTDIEVGWMFSSFLLAYTLAQIPSGVLVDRFGAYRVLGWAALMWFVLTIATAVAADLFSASVVHVVIALVVLRFALGLAEAPTFPAATRAVANWFPAGERPKANAIIQAASYGGSAITMPFMAAAVVMLGWKGGILASAFPALLIGIAWWLFARDGPATHPRVLPAERRLIAEGQAAHVASVPADGPMNKGGIVLLSASYFFHGAVGYLFFFWFYSYLVEERGFSIAESGWVAAMPTAAAAIFAVAGGWACARSSMRYGLMKGGRMLLLVSAMLGAAFLMSGAWVPDATIAISGFVAAIALHGFVEATYWTLAIELGGRRTGLAAGSMNMMSNLGGVVSTALAPVVVQDMGWPMAIAIAAIAKGLAGVPTLFIRGKTHFGNRHVEQS